MDKFFRVMEGPFGRLLRVGLGLGLVYVGAFRMDGTAGHAVAAGGLLPIVMGLWGPCLVHLATRRLRGA